MRADDGRGLPAKIEAARGVAEQYRERGGLVGAYVSGSLLAGLGSATSDVDLFLVLRDDVAEAASPQQLVGDVRVDVEMRSLDFMERLTRDVGTFRAALDDIDQIVEVAGKLDDAVRFLLGRDVIAAPEIDRLRRGLSRDELRRLLIGSYCHDCLNQLQDLVGLLADGDRRSSIHVSRTLLVTALQAFLAGCGELYIGEKWTWRKLARIAVPEARVDGLWGMVAGEPDGPAVAPSRIRLAQALVAAAQLDGWEAAGAAGWTAWGTGATGLHRALEWLPVRVRDGALMASTGYRKVRLGVDGIRLWALADGRPEAEVVDDMLQRLAADARRADVEAYADRLVGMGLLARA